MNLKIKTLILALIVFGFSYYSLTFVSNNHYQIPDIFYLKTEIVKFDESANTYGYKGIEKFRKDEENIQIYLSDSLEILDLTLPRFYNNTFYLKDFISDNKSLTTLINTSGKVVDEIVNSSFTTDTNIYKSDDGKYLVYTETENMLEDDKPGVLEYALVIKNLQENTTEIIKPEDFDFKEDGQYGHINLCTFGSQNEKMYLELFSQNWGDPIPNAIFELDLDTSNKNMIFASNEKYYSIHYFGANKEHTKIYIMKEYMWSDKTEILIYYTETGKLLKLFETEHSPVDNSVRPGDKGIILYSLENYGFYYYDFKAKKSEYFEGEFKSWSIDGNFLVIKLADSAGEMYYGPHKLILHNIINGEERIIYEQTVYNSGYDTKVGDYVYEFIGIK